jgi:hypothetical protein
MIYLLRAEIQQNHQTNGSIVVGGFEPSIMAYAITISLIVYDLNYSIKSKSHGWVKRLLGRTATWIM